MGHQYLADTNTVIEYLNNTLTESAASLIQKVESRISVITRMELLAWPKANKEHLRLLESFIGASIVYNLREPVILKAIEIRRNYGVKLPDAIIAGTALVHDLVLITRNTVDFTRIKELKVLNPYSI